MAFYKCEGVKRKGADAPLNFMVLWNFLKSYKSYKSNKPYKPYKLHAPSLNLLLYRGSSDKPGGRQLVNNKKRPAKAKASFR